MQDVDQYLHVIKPAIRRIEAYHLQNYNYQVKLNQNESPFDLSAALKQATLTMFKAMSWNRYPTFGNARLVEKLASVIGLQAQQILVGNGSNELLQTLVNVTLGPGKIVLLVKPTFLIYEQLANVAGASVQSMEFNEDWSFPVERILETVSNSQVALTILCSPNSPTGIELQDTEIVRILNASSGLVLLDEAYYEFSKNDNLRLLQNHPNLIVTRTFSKAVGLAGLRIGYLAGHARLVQEINKGKLPYNLDLFSELVASTVLDNQHLIKENIRILLKEKQRIMESLSSLGALQVFPSATNFLMVRAKEGAKYVFDGLLKRGILIRDISGYHPRLQNMVRISVGTPKENDCLLQALQEMY